MVRNLHLPRSSSQVESIRELIFGEASDGEQDAASAQGGHCKSEIEVADFDRLFSRLERVEMAVPAMRELLGRNSIDI